MPKISSSCRCVAESRHGAADASHGALAEVAGRAQRHGGSPSSRAAPELPIKADVRKVIAKEEGQDVTVRLDERIDD